MKRATSIAARVAVLSGHSRRWLQFPPASAPFTAMASATAATPAAPHTGNVRVEDAPLVDKVIVATADFPAGTVLVESVTPAEQVLTAPTMHTVCVEEGAHVDVTAPLRYTPHSCSPCGKVEVEQGADGSWTVRVVAVRDVVAGEWVTFDYATTEWDMDAPFACSCGSKACRGSVQGAAHLSPAQAASLFPRASPVVQGLMKGAFGPDVGAP